MTAPTLVGAAAATPSWPKAVLALAALVASAAGTLVLLALGLLLVL